MKLPDWANAVLRGEPPPWNAVGASSVSVVELCDSLEISALVHDRLTRKTPPHNWPDDVYRELARRAHSSAAREIVRAREIERALAALAVRHVRPILFKGAALAHTAYDSPALRPHTDADLLVRRDEVEVVRGVFTTLGYVEPPMTGGELVFCQFQMARRDRFGLQHIFDVHWKISTQALFADILAHDELAAHAVPVVPLGPHARAVGGVHALLLACIHPVMHHRNTDRLIWLYDLDLLVRRLSAPELSQFTKLAVHAGVAEICARQLAHAAERFHTPLPAEVIPALTSVPSTEPSAVYLRANRRWHHELLWNIRSLGRWRDRFRLLREVLFPGTQDMRQIYGLRRGGDVLLPALYVHRCIHGAFKILVRRK